MCGICGIWKACDEGSVGKMVDAQRSRGPDDRGVWADPKLPVTLGHARLSIIDVSNAGHQPMSYAGGRLWVTFNGELYNYRELRDELAPLGHTFRSDSDTEVLLAAYAQWGSHCVSRFRGMFAFALVDRNPPPSGPDLVLARDRLGIKPLVFHDDGERIWFASELRALLAGGVPGKIDREGLYDYFALGSVMQPRTIIAGVQALPPGSLLEVRGAERRLTKYWDLDEATAGLRAQLRGISWPDAVAETRRRLTAAARYHVIADVPVGAFLSGGVDSSVVVGLMAEAMGKCVHTFSVGFDGVDGAVDERRYAAMAARHLGTVHHEVCVTPADACDAFPSIVRSLDQPSVDGANTWLVSRAARRHLTVALSGLGGDELFGGYPHFAMLAEASGIFEYRFHWIGTQPRGLVRTLRPSWRRRVRLLRRLSRPQRLASIRRQLGDDEFSAIAAEWRPQPGRIAEEIERRGLGSGDEIQRVTYAEAQGYLVSTLLRDSDVAGMAHGLEIRPLLLDHEVAELAYALPWRWKVGGGWQKRVLLAAGREFIPWINRIRGKRGFELPYAQWVAGPLRDYTAELLDSPEATALLDGVYRRQLVAALKAGTGDRRLWQWCILFTWLRDANCSF